jgi:hypothetical protein
MTSEEREALFTSLSAILATLRQVEIKIDAAVDTLIDALPDYRQAYQTILDSKRKLVVNDLSTMHEYLRKTLGKNTK